MGACEERMNEKIGDIRERIGGMQEKLERKIELCTDEINKGNDIIQKF